MTPFNQRVWDVMVKFRPRSSEELREAIRVALDKKKKRS